MKKIGLMVCVALAAFFLCAPRATAQATWGAINGYVTDPSGAAVPGANVKAKEVTTGIETTATSDSQGFFNLTHLNPGEYTVNVEAQGFKGFAQEHIVLRVDSTVRTDAKLQMGSVSQEVTVTDAPPLLKTEKTDVSIDLDTQKIDALPTLGRNTTYLYETVPGAVESIFQQEPGENPGGSIQVTVNGAFWANNEYIIDGITDLACCFSNQMVFNPNQESVSAMKLSTNDVDPEFGNSAGLTAQFITKSGTNQLHGSVFWANQNKAFFAADPFTQETPGTGPNGKGLGVAPYNWNQGGFSIGGPIKKNKMFIFGDYQFLRNVEGASIQQTVPTAAERNGDFSALAATNPIYDPTTGSADGTGRTQFSCNGVLNVICPDRINPVTTNLLNLLPLPNKGGTDLNWVGSGTATFRTDAPNVRFDWTINDRDKMFARFSYLYSYLFNPPIFGVVAGGTAVAGLAAEQAPTHDVSVALNYTHTFSPNLLTEVRGGVLRWHLQGYQTDANLRTNDQVGIPGLNNGNPLTGGLAGMTIAGPVGSFALGPGGNGVALPRLDIINVWEGVNNWTLIRGKHQLRWGADIKYNMEDLFTINAHTQGYFDFSQTITGSANVSNSGLGTATMLLGQADVFERGVFNFIPHERQWRHGIYFQDVYRVTPKLTANLGVRWDYYGPDTTPISGGLANFNPNTGQQVLANLGGNSASAGVTPWYNDWAPRVGLAYRVTDQTVIRAGLGRSYFATSYASTFQALATVYPIAETQSETSPNIYQGIFPLQQGPSPQPPLVLPSSGVTPLIDNSSAVFRPLHQWTESVDQWNLTFEHAVTRDFNFSIGYIGNKSTHLAFSYQLNAAPPGLGSLDARRPLYAKYGLEQQVPQACNCSDANYNALQVVANKRFAKGYSINSSYTWSKSYDYEIAGFAWSDQAVNPYDRKSAYGPGTDQNRGQVWIVSHLWQLPYGPGLPFGSDATGVKKLLLGGWQFNGTTILESGFFLSPQLSNESTLNADWAQRPDRVPGVPLYPSNKTRGQWYNPAAFQIPQFPGQTVQCCRYGDATRGSIVGPGEFMTQWAFWKEFRFNTPLNREGTLFQVRWENYNFFNHPVLGNPNMVIDSSQAGEITTLGGLGGGEGYVPMRRMQFTLRLQF
jgi:hypothetical protein